MTCSSARRSSLLRLLTVPFAALVLLPACVYQRDHFTQLVNPERPMVAIPTAQVEVLSEPPRTRPYVNVGLVQTVRVWDVDGQPPLVQQLRTAAGRIGCNAVMVTWVDHRQNHYSQPSIEGSCILYTDVPPTEPAALPAAPLPAPRPPEPAALALSLSQPTDDWQPAVVAAEATDVRRAAHPAAPVVLHVATGQRLWVSRADFGGFRRVAVNNGTFAYIPAGALRLVDWRGR